MTAILLSALTTFLGLGEAREVVYRYSQSHFADLIDGRARVRPCKRIWFNRAACRVAVTGPTRCKMVVYVGKGDVSYVLQARRVRCGK